MQSSEGPQPSFSTRVPGTHADIPDLVAAAIMTLPWIHIISSKQELTEEDQAEIIADRYGAVQETIAAILPAIVALLPVPAEAPPAPTGAPAANAPPQPEPPDDKIVEVTCHFVRYDNMDVVVTKKQHGPEIRVPMQGCDGVHEGGLYFLTMKRGDARTLGLL